jgi:hypothetical protein
MRAIELEARYSVHNYAPFALIEIRANDLL